MSKGGDNPVPILPVVVVVAVPIRLSSRIACRGCHGVLLQFHRWLEEEGRLSDVLGDGAVLVLVELAEAKTKVIDDTLVFLAPGLEFPRGLLDGDEAGVLAELRIDDPLLHRGLSVLVSFL